MSKNYILNNVNIWYKSPYFNFGAFIMRDEIKHFDILFAII